jgi:hypothetical protein
MIPSSGRLVAASSGQGAGRNRGRGSRWAWCGARCRGRWSGWSGGGSHHYATAATLPLISFCTSAAYAGAQRSPLNAAHISARTATGGPAKPTARLVFGLHPAPVLSDPCLSVGFGGERADLGRMGLRNTDLHGERPVLDRDHSIGRLGMGMGPLCHCSAFLTAIAALRSPASGYKLQTKALAASHSISRRAGSSVPLLTRLSPPPPRLILNCIRASATL